MSLRTGLGSSILVGVALLLVLLRSAAAASVAEVEGTVRDAASGVPIHGALVRVPAQSISATSDAAGTSDFSASIPEVTALPTTIEATAAGYAAWTIHEVRLVPGDTLNLDVKMGQSPTVITVPAPRSEARNWPAALDQATAP